MHNSQRFKATRNLVKDIIFWVLLFSILLSTAALICELTIYVGGRKLDASIPSALIALNIIILALEAFLATSFNVRRFIEWRNRGYN